MDGLKVQVLEVVRAALPGVEHFIQETLAFESLSDSARIEWAVLIQHLTKLQHGKVSLCDCISKIESGQSTLPALPTPNRTTLLDTPVSQTAVNETSQGSGMQIPVTSTVPHFDLPSLDLSLDKSGDEKVLNHLDIDTHLLVQSELLVNGQTLNQMLSSDFLNPTDSTNSEISAGGTNDSPGEQDSTDPTNVARPFRCEYCPKRFMRKQHLRQHLTIHTGDKPYHCSLCEKKFMYPSVLRDHLELHLSHPISCSFCSQKFIHKKSYNQHLLKHKNRTGAEKPFVCGNCNKSYRTRWMYKAHVKKYHPSDQTETGSSDVPKNRTILNPLISQQKMKREPIVINDT